MRSVQSGKRNKHARVLTVRRAPSLKWRDFGRLSKQNSIRTLYVF